MSWKKNEAGEWYWPLHVNRPQDHLRVWRTREARPIVGNMVSLQQDEWTGALVLDGEYLDPCRTHPYADAEMAKREVFVIASFYLGVLAGSLAPQLADPKMVTIAAPIARLAARIARAKALAQRWKDQDGAAAADLDELTDLVLAMELP